MRIIEGEFCLLPRQVKSLDMIYASISRSREPVLDQDLTAYPPLIRRLASILRQPISIPDLGECLQSLFILLCTHRKSQDVSFLK